VNKDVCLHLIETILYLLQEEYLEPHYIVRVLGWQFVQTGQFLKMHGYGLPQLADVKFIIDMDVEWQKVWKKLLRFDRLIQHLAKRSIFSPYFLWRAEIELDENFLLVLLGISIQHSFVFLFLGPAVVVLVSRFARGCVGFL